MTTLISFLGKGQDGRGYRPASYRFEDGDISEGQKYLGITLTEKIKPTRVILLGTSGSMWDVFLESGAGSLESEWLELADSVKQQTVDMLQLRPFEKYLQQSMGMPVHCELIPYARNTTEQLEILSRLAELLAEGEDVVIDVTHGFRHLPMLALVAARFLQKTSKINVKQIYYGAFEMSQDSLTPVLELRGLLELLDWVDALTTFDKDGDYSVFASLLESQNFSGANAGLLRKAAFHERTSNSSQSRSALSTIADAMQNLNTPLFNLFKKQLTTRLSWFRKVNRGQQEMQLAREYLDRGDYLRAVIYGLEGLISSRMAVDHLDENDFQSRKDYADRLKDSQSFRKLNHLRNALAHGVKPNDNDTLTSMKDEQRLQQSLRSRFDHLLD
jgi:CRISPR-associated Csx2 family protein